MGDRLGIPGAVSLFISLSKQQRLLLLRCTQNIVQIFFSFSRQWNSFDSTIVIIIVVIVVVVVVITCPLQDNI